MTSTTPDSVLRDARILIVDDEPANVRLLELSLQGAGYINICCTTDSRQALPLFLSFQPNIVLLDLMMPHFDGFGVMQQLKPRIEGGVHVPIIVLTADQTHTAKRKALEEGAADFLLKPLDMVEVMLRIRNQLQVHFQGEFLEQQVRERTTDLEAAQIETLARLALAAEYRDDDTGLHTRRVGLTCARLAEALGQSPAQVDLMLRAAPLHDVGKIGISDTILLKPGKLTDEEFATMKTHTIIGAKILSGSSSPWLQLAEEIALTHHERWDGNGYNRLAGEAIPLSGRIVAVADVFDALTHERPYKKAWPLEEARAEIEAKSGSQFDERVVNAFLNLPVADYCS